MYELYSYSRKIPYTFSKAPIPHHRVFCKVFEHWQEIGCCPSSCLKKVFDFYQEPTLNKVQELTNIGRLLYCQWLQNNLEFIQMQNLCLPAQVLVYLRWIVSFLCWAKLPALLGIEIYWRIASSPLNPRVIPKFFYMPNIILQTTNIVPTNLLLIREEVMFWFLSTIKNQLFRPRIKPALTGWKANTRSLLVFLYTLYFFHTWTHENSDE